MIELDLAVVHRRPTYALHALLDSTSGASMAVKSQSELGGSSGELARARRHCWTPRDRYPALQIRGLSIAVVYDALIGPSRERNSTQFSPSTIDLADDCGRTSCRAGLAAASAQLLRYASTRP